MRKTILLLGIVLAGLAWLLVTPGMAFGQGNTWVGANLQQMIESGRWRFGLVRVNAAFELSNVGYDSDIYYGFFDERIPDVTSSASTPVQVLLPLSKKVVIDVSDTPQYVFYLDTRRERAWNNTFYGQLHVALKNFYIQAGGGLSNVRRRMSSELELNVRQKTDSLSGLVLWQASKSTSLALLYGTAKYDFGDAVFEGTSLAERLNRNETYWDLISYIQPSAKVRLSLDGQYGSYRFTQEASGLQDAEGYALLAGIEFIPGEGDIGKARGLQGAASLGYKRIDMRDPQFLDGSGLVGEASVMAGLNRRMTGQLSFSRGFQFSIYSGASYYLATSFGAGLTRLLSRRASLSYSFAFNMSSYPNFDPGGEGTPTVSYYRYLTHGLSLNLRLARQLGVTFLGTFGQRNSGASVPIRSRFFAGVSLVYGFAGGGMSGPVGGLSR